MRRRERLKRTLRLPPGLAGQLEEAAERNGASVNAEIVRRLRQSFDAGYRQDLRPRAP